MQGPSHRNVLCTSSCDGDQSEIKGSRWRSGHKYDQNQNKMPDVVYTMHTLLTLMLHRAILIVVVSTVLCPVARILWLIININ